MTGTNESVPGMSEANAPQKNPYSEARAKSPLPSGRRTAPDPARPPLPSELIEQGGKKPKRTPRQSESRVEQAASVLYVDDRRQNRRRTLACVALLVVVTLVYLCQSTAEGTLFNNPLDVVTIAPLYAAMRLGSVFGLVSAEQWAQAVHSNAQFLQIGGQVCGAFITLICGGLLAAAGTLYQNAFRNPIAGPSMLGVSNGVQLGVILLVMQFGVSAASMTGLYYLYTYIGAIIVLLVVLGCGKLISGKNEFNVVNMLLVASMISQCCAFITTFLSTYVISAEEWEAYYSITEMTTLNTETISFICLIVAAIIGLLPVYLVRFRMNMISFTDAEARLSGVDPSRMRLVALVCGSIMVIAAQVHCGLITMISLVVPHLSRAIFGADFRKQFWGNIVLGMLVLMVCRLIAGFIPFVGEGMPIGTVASFVTLPLFVWMLARQQRSWD